MNQVSQLEKALTKHPVNPDIMFYLAHLLLQMKTKMARAEALARCALDIEPTSVKYLLLGKIFF